MGGERRGVERRLPPAFRIEVLEMIEAHETIEAAPGCRGRLGGR